MAKQRLRRTLATTVVLVLVLVAPAWRADASIFIVDTTAVDFGDLVPGDGKCAWTTVVPVGQRCSLRAAVEEANAKPGKDAIHIPVGIDYEMLIADDLDITEDVIIGSFSATPDDRPVLDANGLRRMFTVGYGAELTLEKVVITGGAASGQDVFDQIGGAILVGGSASLILEGVALVGNRASLFGSALASFGTTLTIRDTEFEGNSRIPPANTGQSIVYIQGSTASITRSAFANNQGHANVAVVDGGVLVMSNSTIADSQEIGIALWESHLALQNVTIVTGLYPGLAHYYSGFDSSTLAVTNSILSWCNLQDTSGLNSGRNLDILGNCGLDPVIDFPNTNPQLGALRDNGGWTSTMVPEAGSPVIDQGDSFACPSEDQRTAPRTPGAACELGAVELLPCVASHGWVISGVSIFYTFEFETCYTIDAGPDLEVVAGGAPTFRTRDVIRFHDGFTVHQGGEITAINDPNAGSGITLP